MRNKRGEPSERIVEPITVRLAGGGAVEAAAAEEVGMSLESWTEVMIRCGTE